MESLTLYAVGDVGPNREDAHSIFRYVSDLLNSGDVVFANLEVPISDRGTPPPQTGRPLRTPPRTTASIRDTGVDIVAFANNHSLDWGREAFIDTLKHVREAGMAIVGAGTDIADARKSEVITRGDTKIAFLAYNSILPAGYWAEERRAGCVPLRVWTHYEQVELHQPGTPAKVHTFTHREDLAALVDDIKKAKERADIVCVSMHWGTHFVPAELSDYQFEAAYAAIDAGADIIIGHHPHILKGIEVYKGKVIFYSLSNFAFDLEPMWTDPNISDPKILKHIKHLRTLNPDLFTDPECALPYEVRMTGIVKCVITDKKIAKVSFLPSLITKTFEPELLFAGDTRFNDVAAYIEKISRDQDLDLQFRIEGDEMVIVTE